MTREFQIEQRLVNEAAKRNFIAWKWTSTRRGVPDRIVIGNGKVVFVELKAPGEKPTKQQDHVHGLLRAQGQEVWVIDSLDVVDELIGSLESFGEMNSAINEAVTTGIGVIKLDPSKGVTFVSRDRWSFIESKEEQARHTLDAKSLQARAQLDQIKTYLLDGTEDDA